MKAAILILICIHAALYSDRLREIQMDELNRKLNDPTVMKDAEAANIIYFEISELKHEYYAENDWFNLNQDELEEIRDNPYYSLGTYITLNKGVKPELALQILEKEIFYADISAQKLFEICYLYGLQNHFSRYDPLFLKIIYREAERDNAAMINFLAKCYTYGYGIEKNYLKAKSLLKSLQTTHPNETENYILHSRILYAEDKRKEAVRVLENGWRYGLLKCGEALIEIHYTMKDHLHSQYYTAAVLRQFPDSEYAKEMNNHFKRIPNQ